MVRTKEQVIASATKYALEVERLFGDIEVRLYGPYHKGTAKEGSDIDLAVVCDDFGDMDYLLSLKLLNRLKVFVDVEIEPVSLTREELKNPPIGSIASAIAKESELIYQTPPLF